MSRSKTRDIAANELRIIEDGIIDSDAIADGTFTTDTAFANATISLAKLTDDAKEFKPINLTFDSAQTLDLSQGNFFNADSTGGVNTTLSFTNVPAAGKWSYIVKHSSITTTYNTATDITGWTWDYDNRFDAVTFFGIDHTWIEASVEDSGNRFYVAGNNPDTIYQLDLSTPYDLRTASDTTKSLAIGSNTSQIRNIKFKPDGTRMFTSDGADGTLDVYDLSTPWDISTGTYQSSLGFNPSEVGANGFSIVFTPDGLKMYLSDGLTSVAYQYTLSTAWDPSSASYDSKSLNMSASGGSSGDIGLSIDGKKIFKTNTSGTASNSTGGSFTQYNLGTAFDISTGDSGVTRVLNTLFDSSITNELSHMNITYDGDYALFGSYSNTNYQFYLARIPDSSATVQSTLTLPASVKNAVSNIPDSNNPRQYIEFITYDSGTNIYINNDKTFST